MLPYQYEFNVISVARNILAKTTQIFWKTTTFPTTKEIFKTTYFPTKFRQISDTVMLPLKFPSIFRSFYELPEQVHNHIYSLLIRIMLWLLDPYYLLRSKNFKILEKEKFFAKNMKKMREIYDNLIWEKTRNRFS